MEHQKSLKMKDWALQDRPREKLLEKGRQALTDAELIAILIGSGTTTMSAVDVAKVILKEIDNDINRLARLSVKELIRFKGIGEAKAISIVSALELGRRRKPDIFDEKPKMVHPDIVYNYIKSEILDLVHEEFWVLLLNRANQVLRKVRISIGGLSSTSVDQRIIFKAALEESATGIILVHNHPSGNLKPSEMDLKITKKIAESGKILDIQVFDHLIVTNSGYFSFQEQSLIL